jgi:hypothetical protein
MMAAVVARLRDQLGGTTLRTIGGAAELASLGMEGKPPPQGAMPAAYVVPLEDVGQPSTAVSIVRQRLLYSVGVVIMVANLRDPRGEAAIVDVSAVVAQVRAALVGWSPAPSFDPVEFRRGRLVDLIEGVVVWQDEYEAATHLRAG